MHILLLDVGRSVRDESFLSVMVMAHSEYLFAIYTERVTVPAWTYIAP